MRNLRVLFFALSMYSSFALYSDYYQSQQPNYIPPPETYNNNNMRVPGAFDRRVNDQRVQQQQTNINMGNANPPEAKNYYYYQNPSPQYNTNTLYGNPNYNTTNPTYYNNNPNYYNNNPNNPTYVNTPAPVNDPRYNPNYNPNATPNANYPYNPYPNNPYIQNVPQVNPTYGPRPGNYGTSPSQQQGAIMRDYDQKRSSIMNSDQGSYNFVPQNSQRGQLKARAMSQQEKLMQRQMKQQQDLGR